MLFRGEFTMDEFFRNRNKKPFPCKDCIIVSCCRNTGVWDCPNVLDEKDVIQFLDLFQMCPDCGHGNFLLDGRMFICEGCRHDLLELTSTPPTVIKRVIEKCIEENSKPR